MKKNRIESRTIKVYPTMEKAAIVKKAWIARRNPRFITNRESRGETIAKPLRDIDLDG